MGSTGNPINKNEKMAREKEKRNHAIMIVKTTQVNPRSRL